MGRLQDKQVALRDLAVDCIKALGFTSGVFHVEPLDVTNPPEGTGVLNNRGVLVWMMCLVLWKKKQTDRTARFVRCLLFVFLKTMICFVVSISENIPSGWRCRCFCFNGGAAVKKCGWPCWLRNTSWCKCEWLVCLYSAPKTFGSQKGGSYLLQQTCEPQQLATSCQRQRWIFK